jgi:hypothetical protein
MTWQPGKLAARYVESAAGTKGLIIDIRNYPSEFMVVARMCKAAAPTNSANAASVLS